MPCIKPWGSPSKDVINVQFFQRSTVFEYASVVRVLVSAVIYSTITALYIYVVLRDF